MDNTPTEAEQQTATGGGEEGCGFERSENDSGSLPSLPVPPDLLRRLRLAAKRLETYSLRIQTALAAGDRDCLFQALSDVAEAHEIARRLSDSLFAFLAYTPPPEP